MKVLKTDGKLFEEKSEWTVNKWHIWPRMTKIGLDLEFPKNWPVRFLWFLVWIQGPVVMKCDGASFLKKNLYEPDMFYEVPK